MFFRFVATLIIITGISILGMNLEKQNLKLKRIVSSQHYELQSLEESRSQLYLKTQELGAPPKLMQHWEPHEKFVVTSSVTTPSEKSKDSRSPLLEWRMRSDFQRDK